MKKLSLSFPLALAVISAVVTTTTITHPLQSAQASERADEVVAVCGLGQAEVIFETQDFWVYICRRYRGFLYFAKQKSNPQNSIRLAATYNQKTDTYTARNRNTKYLINRHRLQILQNNRQILAQEVIFSESGE